MTKKSARDLTGDQLGYLTVLGPAESLPRDGKRGGRGAWNVRCICGTEKVISRDSLKKMKSCGCKWLDLHKLPEGHGAINHFIASYKGGAKERGHAYELTKEQFYALIQQPCYFCGIPPQQEIPTHKRYNGSILVNGIDRVDNTKGYHVNNCVPCCRVCNFIKGQVTLDIARKMLEFTGE